MPPRQGPRELPASERLREAALPDPERVHPGRSQRPVVPGKEPTEGSRRALPAPSGGGARGPWGAQGECRARPPLPALPRPAVTLSFAFSRRALLLLLLGLGAELASAVSVCRSGRTVLAAGERAR